MRQQQQHYRTSLITPHQPPSFSSSDRPSKRRHTVHGRAAPTSTSTSTTPLQRSPMQLIRQAAVTQEALDARRQGVEAAIASGRVTRVVVAALEALLRSVHADRQTARHCLKALIFDPGDHAAALDRAQESQARLLDRTAHALAFAPLVQRVDAYLRDRNLPPGTVAFCLDQGPASWLRVRVARVAVPLPAGSAAARAFSSCTLEVTRQLPLVAVGPNIRSLHQLFQPMAVTLHRAALAGTDERVREVQLVLEVASAAAATTTTTTTTVTGRPGAAASQQQRFTVEAYGFKTNFPPAAHAADGALLRKWAGRLAPAGAAEGEEGEEGAGSSRDGGKGDDFRVPATRHVLGLCIPVPHPRVVPECAPTPLAIKISVR